MNIIDTFCRNYQNISEVSFEKYSSYDDWFSNLAAVKGVYSDGLFDNLNVSAFFH